LLHIHGTAASFLRLKEPKAAFDFGCSCPIRAGADAYAIVGAPLIASITFPCERLLPPIFDFGHVQDQDAHPLAALAVEQSFRELVVLRLAQIPDGVRQEGLRHFGEIAMFSALEFRRALNAW
jgi:hypothetical protein